MAEEQQTETEEGAEQKKSSKLKLIIIAVIALVVIGAGVGGALFFLGGDEEVVEEKPAEEKRAEAIYTKIRTLNGKPMFVVTLISPDNRPHYMQLYVEAKSRDPEVVKSLEQHMPLIVSRLNNLYSSQNFRELQLTEGKQKLREESTELVQGILQDKIKKPGIEDILFTNMVMQ